MTDLCSIVTSAYEIAKATAPIIKNPFDKIVGHPPSIIYPAMGILIGAGIIEYVAKGLEGKYRPKD